jgi:two-component system cell cycle sensor histidine kinase/response regulator CckA
MSLTPLRVLVVDDMEDDALLVVRELQRSGYAPDWVRVQDEVSLREALTSRSWDLVLSDWSIPGFGALEALATVNASGLDLPFLIVSGTVGEESVVEALHAGAHDFISKDKLVRLSSAVARELREAKGREARRRAESEVKSAAVRYLALFNASPLPMWVTDLRTLGFLAVNDAAVAHYGYSREEFTSLTLLDVVVPDDAGAVREREAYLASVRGGTLRHHRRKDGAIVDVEVNVNEFEFEGTMAQLTLANDVTKRVHAEEALRKSEEQFRQAHKMEAVGRLAAGVAHDFNNLLSVILSYSSLAIDALQPGDPLRDDLREIRESGERAAGLTRQLLAFSRQQVLMPRVIDLAQVVGGMQSMLRRLLREDVQLTILTADKAGRVLADQGQIEQVVMNLAVNARDAMHDGGNSPSKSAMSTSTGHMWTPTSASNRASTCSLRSATLARAWT